MVARAGHEQAIDRNASTAVADSGEWRGFEPAHGRFELIAKQRRYCRPMNLPPRRNLLDASGENSTR
jgi:hypothetical protein